jgi:hypothetical protein
MLISKRYSLISCFADSKRLIQGHRCQHLHKQQTVGT